MKQKMTKVVFVVSSFIFALSTCMVVLAMVPYSFTKTQDGVVATMQFDKKEYSANEEVKVSLNIENTNSFEITNVKTEIVLPSEMTLVSGSLTEEYNLLESENKTNEVVMTLKEDTTVDNPKTSDSIAVYVTMMIISLGCLIIILKENWISKEKTMLLVFGLTLIGAMAITTLVNAESITKSFDVEGKINYDGKNIVIKANISYEVNDEETLSCNDPNCVSCPENNNVCTECAENYELNSVGYCEMKNYTE